MYESTGSGHYEETTREKIIIYASALGGCLLIFGPIVLVILLSVAFGEVTAPAEQAPPASRQAA